MLRINKRIELRPSGIYILFVTINDGNRTGSYFKGLGAQYTSASVTDALRLIIDHFNNGL